MLLALNTAPVMVIKCRYRSGHTATNKMIYLPSTDIIQS